MTIKLGASIIRTIPRIVNVKCAKCSKPMRGIKERVMRSICDSCGGVPSPYYEASTRRARMRIAGELP